ncbi:hypothetical protein QYF36_010083 [Acer negundo]|nr:hypothetical protein QYF36_010083 [Acer negundo]
MADNEAQDTCAAQHNNVLTINCNAGFNEENVFGCFEKQKDVDGGFTNVIIKGKGIMRKNLYQNQNVPLIHNGESSKFGLGHLKRGDIVIELGNGLGQEKNSQVCNYLPTASPNRSSGERSHVAYMEQSEKAQKISNKVQSQNTLSKKQNSLFGNSFSHISETLFHQSSIEKEDRILIMGRERKKSSSKKDCQVLQLNEES